MPNQCRLSCTAIFLALALSLTRLAAAQDTSLAPKHFPSLGTVDERYQSYNIEMVEVTGGRFWAPYHLQADAPPDTQQPAPGGMPASLYRYRQPIDLGNPRLRKLAAALSPAYVRVSGTWANSTYFLDTDETPAPTPPKGFNSVLTGKEWRGVLDFSKAVDAQLVTSFAISPGTRDESGVWMPREAEKILAFTKSAGGSVAAAEFFNEPTFASMGGAPQGYDAAAYGRDFHVFHAFIQKAAPSIKVLGPGGVGETGALGGMPNMHLIKSEDILEAEGPGLDAFSYHFYGAVSKRCGSIGAPEKTQPDGWLTADWLSRTEHDEAFYAALRDRFAPGKPLWLTETAESACGGNPLAADFVDSFRYLNQLGTLARRGVQVVMHNTLAASDYGLIDESTLAPRPNYWAAVLWRRLMGTTVLDPGKPSAPNLYVYAHCLRNRRGGVALLVLNADKFAAHDLVLADPSTRFTLTAPDLMGTEVLLNNVQLNAAEDGTLPSLDGQAQPSGKVDLVPASITFFAIPGAKNSACH